MSSVANNNHGVVFAQQSHISSQKSPPPCGVQMAFYKRDPSGTSLTDCYPIEQQQQHDYTGWSPLPTMNSPPQWNDVRCDTTTPHIGGLPAAHSLLTFPPKSSASATPPTLPTTTVMTNQNGKNFTAPSTTATSITYHRYDDQQHHYPTQYPHKRGASYSGPRPTYLDTASVGMTSMEYVDGRGEPYNNKPTANFHSPTPSHQMESQFPPYRYVTGRDDKASLHVNGLAARSKLPSRYPPTDSAGGSPPASLVSSDGETTASSSVTRGPSSIPAALSVTAAASNQKRPRKPAPTLATGRRNLKSEPVDPDEADRRMKRRERNRKSAQKCRERKLHRTQELQAQVEALNMEASRLLREIEGFRELNRRCINLLQQYCPGVAIPFLNPLSGSPDSYLPTTSAPTSMPIDTEPIAFCDEVDQSDVNFYNKSGQSFGGVMTPASSASVSWNGRSFSPVNPQLPPLSQFVPAPPVSLSITPEAVKPEPPPGGYWKNDLAMDSFMGENHDNHRTQQKTENAPDSSPGCGALPRLNTPNQTNEGDVASSLSSSI